MDDGSWSQVLPRGQMECQTAEAEEAPQVGGGRRKMSQRSECSMAGQCRRTELSWHVSVLPLSSSLHSEKLGKWFCR